jgi:3',5'-cyclic AMP phosphodiesterase CpdA
MKRVAWLTDIHLNFLQPEEVCRFLTDVRIQDAEAVLLGGDIAEGHNLLQHLQMWEEQVRRPTYFVLGNHDFYRSSIATVRRQVAEFCRQSRFLTYLTAAEMVALTPKTGLLGHDGWADSRYGDFAGSTVLLTDYLLIQEITCRDKALLGPRLQKLGDEAAAHLRRVLPGALAKYPHVVVLTHVPPFREACWHEGRISSDGWLPHFACKAAGEVLLEVSQAHPHRRITVLCGHSHGRGETQISDNLRVLTGGAIYGRPEVQRILEVE